ncbi:MAG: hypothetical protein K2X93_10425 [Candidatus Obscuribacterales bacterium]|nr:hypothetical protein [Candidatus Obscuribacterales bacterium]
MVGNMYSASDKLGVDSVLPKGQSQVDEQQMSLEQADSFVSTRTLPTGFWKILVSCFIVVYFGSVIGWLSDGWPYKEQLAVYFKDINILDGATQHWSLFSPQVRHQVYHESMTITFKDGSIKYYEFPRMEKLGEKEKFVHEKLRKVFGDCIPWEGYRHFLPDITSYLAGANQDTNNQPTLISMIFNWAENPPPDPAHWNYRNNLPAHSNKQITFTYAVRDADVSSRTGGALQNNPKVLDEK